MEKGIWAVTHLMDNSGNFLNYEDFCETFNFRCPIREFNRVIKAIPVPLKTMIQQLLLHSNIVSELRPLCIEGIHLCHKQFSNKFIRNVLSAQYYPNQLRRKYVLKDYSNEEAKKIRKPYLSYPILPKAKEVTFKILNDFYPSIHFLHIRFNWNNNSCGFCEKDIETVEHIFFQCEPVQEFWFLFQSWLQSKGIVLHPINVMSIKAGVFMEEKSLDFLLNNLIVLAKHFIHRCKYLKVKPHINGWKNELKLFTKSLQCMTDKNALKLLSLLDLFMLLD